MGCVRHCRDSVSRLSAHLHSGMVSPFRVARDALAAASFGAGKFVDEYLTWREVAYAFCFHHSADLDSLKVRKTKEHGVEGRPCFVHVPFTTSPASLLAVVQRWAVRHVDLQWACQTPERHAVDPVTE